MANDRKQEAAGGKKKQPRPLADIIADEPDLLQRCIMLCGGMIFATDAHQTYSSPEDYVNGLKDKPIMALLRKVAESPAESLEWIEDAGKRTPEQQQAMEAAAHDALVNIQALVNTNYIAAAQLLEDYATAVDAAGGDTTPLHDYFLQDIGTDAAGGYTAGGYTGDTLNVPLAAILFFFATHEGLDPLSPVSPEGFTADDKSTLIDIFADMDSFYREHKSEFHTLLDLQQAYIAAKYPNQEQAAATLGRLNKLAVIPKHHVSPNNSLANALTRATRKSTNDIIKIALEVSQHGAKKKVTSTCLLSYEGDNVKISGRQPYTEYDRAVHDAVCSLFVAGNRFITSDMVWRAMTGKTEQEKPSKGIKSAVTKSLDKMRFMRARIDCSDEFQMRRIRFNGDSVTGGGFDDNLLHLKGAWVETAKGKTWGYEILSAPVLYQYSAAVKQVQTVPIGLLDVKTLDKHGKPTTHSLEYTERRVVIKGYLLRRIEGMKGNNKLASRCISFMDYMKDGQTHDGLYTIAGSPELSQPMPEGLTDTEKAKRKNDARYIRADAAKILGYWKAIGYIQGYREYKERTAVAGYEIML